MGRVTPTKDDALTEDDVREIVSQIVASEQYDQIISELEDRIIALEEKALELAHRVDAIEIENEAA
jgi:uncharacterized membrane protein